MVRFPLTPGSTDAADSAFVVVDPGLVIRDASVLPAPPLLGVENLLDGTLQYVVSALPEGGSTVVSLFLPESLQQRGVNGNALVKFNVQSGLFEEYLDIDGTPLYRLLDDTRDGIIDRIDILLRDGDPRWDGDGLADGSVADPAGYLAAPVAIQAGRPEGLSRGRQRVEGNLLANAVRGSKGKDLIIGGLGADTMKGRGGGDRYAWQNAAESGALPGSRDLITDFRAGSRGDPIDRLKLRPLGPDLEFIGARSFTAAAGKCASRRACWRRISRAMAWLISPSPCSARVIRWPGSGRAI